MGAAETIKWVLCVRRVLPAITGRGMNAFSLDSGSRRYVDLLYLFFCPFFCKIKEVKISGKKPPEHDPFRCCRQFFRVSLAGCDHFWGVKVAANLVFACVRTELPAFLACCVLFLALAVE